MIEDYIYELTGSSLQTAEEVDKVAGALGIDDAALRKRIVGLKTLFVARNEISHELDLCFAGTSITAQDVTGRAFPLLRLAARPARSRGCGTNRRRAGSGHRATATAERSPRPATESGPAT